MRPMNEASIEFLEEIFDADFEAGVLFWKKKISRRVVIGSPVGTKRPTGHLYVQIKGKVFAVHRIIWAMYHKKWPTEMIDHKNMNPLDNGINNLRLANKSQNGCNRSASRSSKTGVKGVFLNKKTGGYRAQIKANNKLHYLGNYKSIEDAENAYIAASKNFHGEYSIYN